MPCERPKTNEDNRFFRDQAATGRDNRPVTLEEYVASFSTIEDADSPVRDGDYTSDTTGKVGYWAEYK